MSSSDLAERLIQAKIAETLPLTPRYLGDAVYIQHDAVVDGWYILTTDSHTISEADMVIFLNDSVITEFLKYLKDAGNPNVS